MFLTVESVQRFSEEEDRDHENSGDDQEFLDGVLPARITPLYMDGTLNFEVCSVHVV